MKAMVQSWTETESPGVLGSVRSNYASGIPSDFALLHEMAGRIAMDAPLQELLANAVEFVDSVVKCDSCFVYVLEQDRLVLRASKNPHPEAVNRLRLKLGAG